MKPEPFKMKKFTNVQSKLSTIISGQTIDTAEAISPSKMAAERPRTAASARKAGSVIAFGRHSHQKEDLQDKENSNVINMETTEEGDRPTTADASIGKHRSYGKVP